MFKGQEPDENMPLGEYKQLSVADNEVSGGSGKEGG